MKYKVINFLNKETEVYNHYEDALNRYNILTENGQYENCATLLCEAQFFNGMLITPYVPSNLPTVNLTYEQNRSIIKPSNEGGKNHGASAVHCLV